MVCAFERTQYATHNDAGVWTSTWTVPKPRAHWEGEFEDVIDITAFRLW